MSVITRYIDVHSQNRDRTQYSNPAQFQLQFDANGARTSLTAVDPVCSSAPYLRFFTSFNKTGPTNTITGTFRTGASEAISSLTGGTIVICRFATTTSLHQENDFYAGAVLRFTDGTIASRRITAYKYLFADGSFAYVKFTLESAPPDSAINGASVSVTNPTDNGGPNAHVFIPTGSSIDNYYVNWQFAIVNRPSPFYETYDSPILAYDGVTRIATLDGVIGGEFSSTGNEIILRQSAPVSQGLVFTVSASYNPDPPNAAVYAATYANNTTRFFLDSTLAGDSLVETAIAGSWIRLMDGDSAVEIPAPGLNNYDMVKIISSELVTVKYGSLPTETRQVRKVTVGTPVSFTPAGGVATDATTFQIMPFSYDNSQPISFSGNVLQNSDIVCYEIKLINLLLPNTRILLNGSGGKFSTYPYVWVEFTGVNANVKDAIWSNARSSSAMLFKVPMKDVNHPNSADFIKLDGAGMSQFIPFKPADTFNFSVRLPDGTVPLIGTDSSSIVPPNDLLQISATFEIRRRS